MKRILLPLVMAFVLTGCSTYQYSSRTVGIDRYPVGAKEVAAEIVVNYDKVVTASSNYQLTKSDAIIEAQHRCIVDNNIDVIVDPIVKVERFSGKARKKYRATIQGFAGMYKVAKTGVDAVKGYTKEDIEKYKLLSDPDFARYYYNQSSGDTYYINSNAPAAPQKPEARSLAFAPKQKTMPMQQFDFMKAKRLRDAGIGLTVVGALMTSVLGSTVFALSDEDLGMSFMFVGSAATVAGIPMWCVGAVRMKNSDRDAKVSVGSSKSGLGLRFNF